MTTDYVHGYSGREHDRLVDQATTLTDLLHHDTSYPSGALVLEAGCGVGAQTATLATRSPRARLVSVDISAASLAVARTRTGDAGAANVEFHQADVYGLPFPDERFDHVFVCFVLEHLARPVAALAELRRVLKRGGTITVIEGDHGSVEADVHRDGRRRPRACPGGAPHRRSDVGPRHPRPLPDRGSGRNVLLRVLQGRGGQQRVTCAETARQPFGSRRHTSV